MRNVSKSLKLISVFVQKGFEEGSNVTPCLHSVLDSVVTHKEHSLWQSPGLKISKTRFLSYPWDELNGQKDNSSV